MTTQFNIESIVTIVRQNAIETFTREINARPEMTDGDIERAAASLIGTLAQSLLTDHSDNLPLI